MSRLKLVAMAMFFSLSSFANAAKTLDEVLELAYKNNPELNSNRELIAAEEALIVSKATLEDPMIGFSNLNRNMETQYGTITQKFRFPVKYVYQAKMQKSRFESQKSNLEIKRFAVRQKVTSLYYSIYSTQKLIELTMANMQAVKEFARVAEKKYAAGKSPQGDSMKAHFELTQLELDLLRLQQEEGSLQSYLKAVLNDQRMVDLHLEKMDVRIPIIALKDIGTSVSEVEAKLERSSPRIRAENQMLLEADYARKLAQWEFAPDFQLQYQQRISGEPTDSKIYSVGMTVPLWFWKKSSEATAASAKKMAREYQLQDVKQKAMALVNDLKGKVDTGLKTLKIYETSLIPQAQGAYNSSRAAYRANKTSFLDLLDSERSLYRVKTGFFKALRQYVDQLGELESQLGENISNLTGNHEVMK